MGSTLGILRNIWKDAVMTFMKALSRYLAVEIIGVTLGRGQRGLSPLPPIFFLPVNSVVATELRRERGQIKKSGLQGMYVYYGLVQTSLPPLSNLTLVNYSS